MPISLDEIARRVSPAQLADIRRQMGATGAPPEHLRPAKTKAQEAPAPRKGKRRGPPKAKLPNRNETRFRVNLIADWEEAREVRAVMFEAITLNLADGEKYTPDYPVWPKSGLIEFWEVKGEKAWEDSRIKFKHACDKFPAHWFFWAAWDKHNHVYEVEIWKAGRYIALFECGPAIGQVSREVVENLMKQGGAHGPQR